MALVQRSYPVHGTSYPLPGTQELHERLGVRLQYARFKLVHDRIAHTLDELENLYLRPFRTQAEKRARSRRDDPDRRERRAMAAKSDDAREGEHEARQAGRGLLVFDGSQPTLLQVRPEVAAEEVQRTRKRRRAAALEWASPPPRPPCPVARRSRPPTAQLVRFDSQPEIPARLDMSELAGATITKVDTVLHPLVHDSQNSLARDGAARRPRVYTVPVAKDGDVGATAASRGGGGRGWEGTCHAAIPTTSAFFAPVDLQDAVRAPDDLGSSTPTRKLSRPRNAAISPFSSRSTLESAGETLAPASSVNSLQQTSLSETSPRLANARVPPTSSASSSTTAAARKPFVSCTTSMTATDLAALDDDDNEAFSLAHLHQRPYSRTERTVLLPATNGRPTPASSAVPRTHDLPLLGAQPSFSALPPVPPLPFEFAPPFVGGGSGNGGGFHAPYSQTRSSYPSESDPSVRTRQSGAAGRGTPTAVGDADTYGNYGTVTSLGRSSSGGGGSGSTGSKHFSDSIPPPPVSSSSSPGWEVSFAPPRGSGTTMLPESSSRSSTVGSVGYASASGSGVGAAAAAAAAAAHLLLEQDVLRRFSTAAHEEDMAVGLYPPLSQETVIESGQSQDTGEMSDVDDNEHDGEEGNTSAMSARFA
ncbi:hypothetical protein JCM3774_000843 [Rhodotorula dairenensis]